MSNTTNTTSGGVSGLGLLGILFVGLKLCGVIDWSWWWVTLPFWGPVAIAMTFLLCALAFWGIVLLLPKRQRGNTK